MNNAKIGAAAKMAWGAFRIAGAVATGTGHGLLGSYFRSHHQMNSARLIAKRGIEKGSQAFRDGLNEWRQASR